MIKFEVVTEYKEKNINLPRRKTLYSAGYDLEAAEDIVVPSLFEQLRELDNYEDMPSWGPGITKLVGYFETKRKSNKIYDIEEISDLIKKLNLKTLIPTGIKVCMEDDMYLEIDIRSSIGSKCLLQLANQTGIIDADYYNNDDNEGHIFIPVLNLSPYAIQIKKGEAIAQGILRRYIITDDDNPVNNKRKGGFGSTTEKDK